MIYKTIARRNGTHVVLQVDKALVPYDTVPQRSIFLGLDLVDWPPVFIRKDKDSFLLLRTSDHIGYNAVTGYYMQ